MLLNQVIYCLKDHIRKWSKFCSLSILWIMFLEIGRWKRFLSVLLATMFPQKLYKRSKDLFNELPIKTTSMSTNKPHNLPQSLNLAS